MKFRVERDVLADAVAWAARSLPVRPSVPVLAGLLIERQPTTAWCCPRFDYETSARATLHRRGQRRGPGAGQSGRLLADICRSLPAKPVEMVLDGARVSLTCGSARFSLQTMPVEDYPTLPQMPAGDRHGPAATLFAHAVAQAVTAAGRDDMLPVLTGVRIEIDGLDHRAARHRPLPALPARADLEPAHARRVDRGRAGPGQGARRHRQVADRRQPRSPSRCRHGGAGEGIIGFEGHAPRRRTPDHHPAPGRRVPEGPQPVPRRAPDHRPGRQGRPGRVGQARLAGRRAQHRGPAGLQRRRADPRRRLAATRRRPPSRSRRPSTARTSPPASTRSSCSTG